MALLQAITWAQLKNEPVGNGAQVDEDVQRNYPSKSIALP